MDKTLIVRMWVEVPKVGGGTRMKRVTLLQEHVLDYDTAKDMAAWFAGKHTSLEFRLVTTEYL